MSECQQDRPNAKPTNSCSCSYHDENLSFIESISGKKLSCHSTCLYWTTISMLLVRQGARVLGCLQRRKLVAAEHNSCHYHNGTQNVSQRTLSAVWQGHLKNSNRTSKRQLLCHHRILLISTLVLPMRSRLQVYSAFVLHGCELFVGVCVHRVASYF